MAAIHLTPNIALVGGGVYGLSHLLDCNVYLIHDGREAALIDAGAGVEPERIVANVREAGVERLESILLTHAHADHACGAEAIRSVLGGQIAAADPDAGLIVAGDDEALGLDAARRGGTYPPDYQYRHSRVDRILHHGDEVRIGRLAAATLAVPSHSLGSVCFQVGDALLSGDVVFVGGTISLLNVPGCELANYRANMRRLAGLGVRALLPGHSLFCLEGGQRHIDRAITELGYSRPPRNLS